MSRTTRILSILSAAAACTLAAPRSEVRAPSPCEDFFQYTCGDWIAAHPIPKQNASWGRTDELRDHNSDVLHQILESARAPEPDRSVVIREIGDYYESCMDEGRIDKTGTSVLDDEMKRIVAIDSAVALLAEVSRLHRVGIGVFWGFTTEADRQNARVMSPELYPRGMTLPGRAYYVRQDDRSVAVRAKFGKHIADMFTMLGDSPETARAEAATVLRMESRLAQNAMEREDQIDPTKTTHRMTVSELSKLAPHVDWPRYFSAMNAPTFDTMNVDAPGYLKGMDALLADASMDDIRTYLRWRLLTNSAGLLPARFVNEDFAFFGSVLQGSEEIRPRWWRCTQLADGQLGEALGQAFVDRMFGAPAKARMLALVHEIEVSIAQDVQDLTWMTDPTREQALAKLHKLTRKIGYPDHWIDYSKVKIARDDLFGNSARLSEFAVARDLAKIGKPADPLEWDLTPPTVNADYDPTQNTINFPAGILQAPFFDVNADDAENLGAIGVIVGHELSHGFDNNGRRFDANGNLRDWWTPDDDKAFQQRSECLIQEYGAFDFVPGLKGNGKLTLGENIADNGGMRIAYMTLERLLDQSPGAREKQDASGLTPEQRFFVAFGRSWCQSARQERNRLLTLTNEHSLPKWRVNGTVQNMPEFQQAFGCHVGQAMVRQPACRVW